MPVRAADFVFQLGFGIDELAVDIGPFVIVTHPLEHESPRQDLLRGLKGVPVLVGVDRRDDQARSVVGKQRTVAEAEHPAQI